VGYKNNSVGAIILGGHIQGYGIARIFGEEGIPSIVIDHHKFNITKQSRYCIKSYVSDYDNTLSLLLKLSEDGLYKKWLLFPTDDYYVRLLSVNKVLLSDCYTVTVDNWDVIELFFNKRLSYPLAESSGVPIPKTIYPNSIKELQQSLSEMAYPCIIKPAIMKDFYQIFKQKVLLCKSSDELLKNYDTAIRYIDPHELMIQEIIPGNSENQYSVGVFHDSTTSHNHLIARRRRQHPLDFGNATTYAETVDIPLLFDYAGAILDKAGFTGLCEVEFKYDNRDGKYKFLEVNPRLWKWHLIAKQANVPLLMSLHSYFSKGMPIVTDNFKPAAWRDVITDLPVILQMKRNQAYTKAMKLPIINAVWNASDPKPFLLQVLMLPYLFITRR